MLQSRLVYACEIGRAFLFFQYLTRRYGTIPGIWATYSFSTSIKESLQTLCTVQSTSYARFHFTSPVCIINMLHGHQYVFSRCVIGAWHADALLLCRRQFATCHDGGIKAHELYNCCTDTPSSCHEKMHNVKWPASEEHSMTDSLPGVKEGVENV